MVYRTIHDPQDDIKDRIDFNSLRNLTMFSKNTASKFGRNRSTASRIALVINTTFIYHLITNYY